jgi:hypothetical protein
MTIQNAGLGYDGYLTSPSGQGLPAGSGGTPAGAQFTLMTQNEINDQPPWAVALEELAGEAIALVGLSILTLGTGDVVVAETEIVDATVDAVTVNADYGSFVSERILTDSFFEEMGELNFKDVYGISFLEGSSASIVEEVSALSIESEALSNSFVDNIGYFLAYL